MPLPAPLLRRNPIVHKNTFGHVLILAGSSRMLGACALSGLAAMRAGAGLVTIGIPASLNLTVQKKISAVLMTLPLPETPQKTLSLRAYNEIQKRLKSFQVIAIGPGLSTHPETQRFILKVIEKISLPLVIDADALSALATDIKILKRNDGIKILTPHPGEMARLTGLATVDVERNRLKTAKAFAQKFHCILVLKGHRTVVTTPDGRSYVNQTGNAGMATAGSGDVLAGMIAAFLGQGIAPFDAVKLAVHLHGKAGDYAAKAKTKAALIASDIIEYLPKALKSIKWKDWS